MEHTLRSQLIGIKPEVKQGLLSLRLIGTAKGNAIYSTPDKKYRYISVNGSLKAIEKEYNRENQ